MTPDEARDFIGDNPRAVMLTHRADGRPQLSPVVAAVGGDGRLMVSTRETAMKAKNLARDPRTSLCFLPEGFFGRWVRVDGTAEVVRLPAAMDLLVDYYRRLSGEHDDWDGYRGAMERERRVMVLVTVDEAGPDRAG